MIPVLTRKFYEEYKLNLHKSVDQLFGILMIFQWVFGIIAAIIISPKTWIGTSSYLSINLYAAIILGALTNLIPAIFTFIRPGHVITRHMVALGQSLTSALLIHLTGGRIETHFHVFGSLAFLAAYRDINVLITATSVTAIDHFVRGIYYPQSVFGVIFAGQLRWLEHAAWVIFEDIFLIFSIKKSHKEMLSISQKQAELALTKDIINEEVKYKTKELEEFNYTLAHELRSSLRSAGTLMQWLESDYSSVFDDDTKENINLLKDKLNSMQQFINSLLEYSRLSSEKGIYEKFDTTEIVKSIIAGLQKNQKITYITLDKYPVVECNKEHFSKILLLLIENALIHNVDRDLEIKIDCKEDGEYYNFSVSDNGIGIAKEHQERIFKLFQRLKADKPEHIGFSLSLVKKIIEINGGKLDLDSNLNQGAIFYFRIPKERQASRE